MSRSLVILALLGFLGSPLLERTGVVEVSFDRHDHGDLTDADASHPGHEHGDADDHHESPDSPCHHHIVQCCCTHNHGMVAPDLSGLTDAAVVRRLSAAEIDVEFPHLLKSLLHVPIA